jgi:hypothetical protein
MSGLPPPASPASGFPGPPAPERKVRRVRISTRLPIALRQRLTKHCAASGLSERAVIEQALDLLLDKTSERELVLHRLDRIDESLARGRQDVELLSFVLGGYIQLWLLVHRSEVAVARDSPEWQLARRQYENFTRVLAKRFFREGERFIDALPPELVEEGEAPVDANVR